MIMRCPKLRVPSVTLASLYTSSPDNQAFDHRLAASPGVEYTPESVLALTWRILQHSAGIRSVLRGDTLTLPSQARQSWYVALNVAYKNFALLRAHLDTRESWGGILTADASGLDARLDEYVARFGVTDLAGTHAAINDGTERLLDAIRDYATAELPRFEKATRDIIRDVQTNGYSTVRLSLFRIAEYIVRKARSAQHGMMHYVPGPRHALACPG